MRQLVTEILTRFQKGELTLEQATERLLSKEARGLKAESDERIRDLCDALQREQNPDKIQELKESLTHEFYHGDKPS